MLKSIENIDNKNPFKVPENYFENFKKDIMLQIATLEPEQKIIVAPKITLWRKTLSWSAVAATFLGAVLTLNSVLTDPEEITTDKPGQNKVLTASKTTEDSDFYQYIEEETTRGSFNETILGNDNIY